jgi:hypothetical protein
LNALLIGIYAGNFNKNWKKKNKIRLKALDLLKPNFDFTINVDIRQMVRLSKSITNSRDKEINTVTTENNFVSIGTQMG